MPISREMYKRETIHTEAVLKSIDDDEIEDVRKNEEDGTWTKHGLKPGLKFTFLDSDGNEWTTGKSKSVAANGGIYKLLLECYGHKAIKKALPFKEATGSFGTQFVEDTDYFWSLAECLIGQRFNLTIETGRFTKIKEMELVADQLKLPSKEEAAKKAAELTAPAIEEDEAEKYDPETDQIPF